MAFRLRGARRYWASIVLASATLAINLPAKAEVCRPFVWTTLGTAGGPVPTVDRAEPSNLLRAGERHILVDAGDGTVNQLAKIGLNLVPIRDVFISHHHLDHTGGLAAVVGLRWMNNAPGQLTVYGPPGTAELVAGIVASMQPQARIGFGVGDATQPPASSVKVVELADGQQVQLDGLTVTAAANSHFHPPPGAAAVTALSLSYRFDFAGRSITYSGDTGPSDRFTQLTAGSDLLVSEVMDLDPLLEGIRRQRPDMPSQIFQQMRTHLSTHHLTGTQVGEVAAEADVAEVLLTHFAIPDALAASAPALLAGVRTHFEGPVQMARDLMSIDVGCETD